MLFFDDTLESVVTIGGVSATQCLFQHLRSGNYTVSYFYSRDGDSLFTDCSLEFQIQFGFCHFRYIVERCFHRVAAAHLVRDSLVVTFHFFALEYGRLTLSFATVPFQYWSHFYHSLLVEVLFGEFSVDCSGNFTTYSLQNLRSYGEIIR